MPPGSCFNPAMNEVPALEISDNTGRQRFEAVIDGAVSYAEYTLGTGTITFTHTLVPAAQRGRGIGTQLVRAALEAAQAQRRGVIPQCSLFADYMRRHPETQRLLAPAGRALVKS